jgi:hypothetical protein
MRLRGKPIQLDVRPRPLDSAGHALLPASALTLTESWQPDKHDLSTGEPLTRHLHLSAVGVPSTSLPDLASLMVLPDGIKAYPDQAKLASQMQGNDLVSSADLDIALIASRPGHYVLPALTLSWWDTAQNKQRELTLPARTLDVTGAALSVQPPVPTTATHSQTTTPSAQSTTSSTLPWRKISFGLLGLWLITLLAWLWDHRRLARRTPITTALQLDETAARPTASLAAVQAACRANDALQARQLLIHWANATWPEQPLRNLQEIAQRLANPALVTLLAELDRACYAQDTGQNWQGSDLAAQLQQQPTAPNKKPKTGFGLDQLYP